MFKAKQHLGSEKLDIVLGETLMRLILLMEIEVTAHHQIKDQVKVSLILEMHNEVGQQRDFHTK